MKKIINGKKYDTETAKFICGYLKNRTCNLTIIDEDLYIKKTGEFFIVGYGGPLTEYGVRNGNNISDSTRIIPISVSEAKEFIEKHADVTKYEEIFGEILE